MYMYLTVKRLKELIRGYNAKFQIKGYSKMKKEELMKALKEKNYKVHFNEKKKKHELHPIKDPRRTPKIK